MSASRSLRWIKRGLLALYTFQIALVVWWEILPMERREANGLRYEIRRGFAPPPPWCPCWG